MLISAVPTAGMRETKIEIQALQERSGLQMREHASQDLPESATP
jgi:hypothetical protein